MAERLNREEMLSSLHELDNELEIPVRIQICGASCGILNHGLERASTDVDLLRSSLGLDDERLRRPIKIVARAHGLEDDWINDVAKKVFEYIPMDFPFDIEQIPGETFERLRPQVISKPDFVITKLARHDYIRQWDRADIGKLELSQQNVMTIYRKLDFVAQTMQYNALSIEAAFKAIRPELVKTDKGFEYTNEKELESYACRRYGVLPDQEQVDIWKEGFNQVSIKPGIEIAMLDTQAAGRVKMGYQKTIEADKAYRLQRAKNKEIENGLDI